MYVTIPLSSVVCTSFAQAQVFYPFRPLRKQLGAVSGPILGLPLLASHCHPGNPPALPELLPTLCICCLPGSWFPFSGGQRAWIGSGIDPCSFQAWKAGLSRSCFNNERERGGQRGRGRPGMGDSLDQRRDLDGSKNREKTDICEHPGQVLQNLRWKMRNIHEYLGLVWFWPCRVGSSQPGTKPVLPAVEPWSLKNGQASPYMSPVVICDFVVFWSCVIVWGKCSTSDLS